MRDLFSRDLACANCGTPLGVAYLETVAGTYTCCHPCSIGHACNCSKTGAQKPGMPVPVAVSRALQHAKKDEAA